MTAAHAAATTTNASSAPAPSAAAPHTDAFEVGWLFVQEYYTFLNKDPQRLHCFYNKKSTFLHGHEGGTAKTCSGQTDIHNRIMELDFQDCKVLVSNLDSLPSHDGGIIVQVLGEMSNKGGACHKFAQTFFLAVQPNGYYVLNDIFRFLKEDIDNVYEDAEDPVPKNDESVQDAAPTAASAPAASAPAPAQQPAAEAQPAVSAPSAAPAATHAPVANGPVAAPAPVAAQQPAKPAPAPAEKPKEAPVASKVEKPKESAPAPQSASPKKNQQASAAAPAAAPSAPSQPKSWAALASSSNPTGAAAAAPVAAVSAVVSAPAQPAKPAAKNFTKGSFSSGNFKKEQGQQQPQGAQDASAAQQPALQQGGNDDFREVQSRRDFSRRSNPNVGGFGGNQGSNATNPNEDRDKCSIYIRSVPDGVDKDMLYRVFGQVGSVRNVEVPVGRNIAFVEFSNPETAQKAIGTPFDINGTKVVPEERRRPSGYRGNNSNRHSYNGGNGAPSGSAQGSGGRGGYGGRGRGRGRGGFNNSSDKAPSAAAASAAPAPAQPKA